MVQISTLPITSIRIGTLAEIILTSARISSRLWSGDIALNVPKHKFGGSIQYLNPDLGLGAQLRLRYVDSFPVISGVFIGDIDSYATLDLNAGYSLPFSRDTRFSLTIQNLLDNNHQETVGGPEIGRLAMVRLTQSF